MGAITEAGPFRCVLVTRGRRTGREHAVTLRAVGHGGKVYFSRHRPDGDWFQNALASPDVRIEHGGRAYAGRAREVRDLDTERKISMLKYPGEARAAERRVAIEVAIDTSALP